MGEGGVGERILGGGRQLHRAVEQDVKEIRRCRFERLAGCSVVEQGRAGDEQRTLGAEDPEIDVPDRAGGVAEADEQAAHLEAVERGDEGVLADTIIDHRDTGSASDLANLGGDRLAAVVDHVVGAEIAGDGSFFGRSDRGDHRRPEVPQPLQGNLPHPTGRGMEKHGIARAAAIDLANQILAGQTLEKAGGGLGVRDAIGQGHDPIRLDHMLGGVGANGAGAIGHPLPQAQPLDTGAKLGNRTRSLQSNATGQDDGIKATAMIGINIVDANGGLGDQNLARTRGRFGDLSEHHDLGTTGLRHADGGNHGGPFVESDRRIKGARQSAVKGEFLDTIIAVASGPGAAGVAVLRLSGPRADDVLRAMTQTELPEPRLFALRVLRDAAGHVLDQALVVRFQAGASYTNEPVVELHCHGGRAVVAAVMSAALAHPGVRLAEPGEFTRRAFLAGRLDLTQVEALADLVAAETEAQRRQAMRGFGGAVQKLYAEWRADLLRAAALTEVTIDWVDEEVPEDVSTEVQALITRVRAGIARELAGAAGAAALRQGFEVALVGAPNAGKSSLLNALAGRDAAITSPLPGTTRDVIELRYDLDGLPVIFLDMAGLRDTVDAIEELGVAKARVRAAAAEMRLFLAAPGIDPVVAGLWQPGDLVIWSKCDLGFGPGDVAISALTGQGLTEMLAKISDRLSARVTEVGVVGHLRQTAALRTADLALTMVAGPAEVMAEGIRSAMRALDAMIGHVGIEDVLGEIFSRFCLGK